MRTVQRVTGNTCLAIFLALFISTVPAVDNVWEGQLGGFASVQPQAIEVAGDGSVYSTGYFWATGVDLDPGAGVFDIVGQGVTDGYVSKLDANGNFVWGAHLASPYEERWEN